MQLIDLLEGVTFIRASFSGIVFERWLGNIRQQPALMALTDACLRHAAAELAAPDCGCRASTPLARYPTTCCVALVRSHILLAELDLGVPYLNTQAARYRREAATDIEEAFTDWRRERAAAGLDTLTGWCAALHQAVLTLPCHDFPVSRILDKDLAILKRINELAS